MKPEPARQHGHPALDEEAFEQLLSAAYVMQEHNARLKQSASSTNGVARSGESASFPTPEPQEQSARPDATHESGGQSLAAECCRQCGHGFRGAEVFCGNCGTPRAAEAAAGAHAKTWTSLWDMHETKANQSDGPPAPSIAWNGQSSSHTDDGIELFPAELEEIVAQFAAREDREQSAAAGQGEETALVAAAPIESAPHGETGETAELTRSSPWTSAAKAHAWFESLKAQQSGKARLGEIWRLYGGTFCIAAASLFLLFVLVDWGLQPSPQSGNGPRQLSGFEQMLVSLGLAEVTPSSQSHRGNPDTQVWVDPHTALYYCPGADLYGKTKDGRITSQIEAQRDQFEPATRKACD